MNLVHNELPSKEFFEQIYNEDKIEEQAIGQPLVEHYSDVIAKHEAELEAEAMRRAKKHIKKNQREITRLKNLAEKAIYQNNFISYQYAIKKLRSIYKIKGDGSDIKMLWETTRKTLLEVVREAQKQQA